MEVKLCTGFPGFQSSVDVVLIPTARGACVLKMLRRVSTSISRVEVSSQREEFIGVDVGWTRLSGNRIVPSASHLYFSHARRRTAIQFVTAVDHR